MSLIKWLKRRRAQKARKQRQWRDYRRGGEQTGYHAGDER